MEPSVQVAFVFVVLSGMSVVTPAMGCVRSTFTRASVGQYHDAVFDVDTVSPNDKRAWFFAFSGNRKPSNFLDDNGTLTGFDVDFVLEVCRIANKRCEVVLSEFTECTFTSRNNMNLAGRGLMSEWFDACPAWIISEDRLGAFDFTTPYKATDSSFAVAPGNPSGFDAKLDDYSKFKIVHLNGSATSSQCLTRLGKRFGDIQIASSLPDAKAKLLSREADALFSPRSEIPGLDVLPQRFHCDLGGIGVMTKKGSELKNWWNPAFAAMVSSGKFTQFCTESAKKYNYAKFRCLDNPSTTFTFVPEKSDKTWLFAVSGRRNPYNFLDGTGKLVGYDVDFIKEVCKIASKRCELVLTEFTECVFTNRNINFPGRGIMDGWFDTCVGYVDSVDRRNNYDFTHAFLKTASTFTVASGNPSGFDPVNSDYSNFTLTHLTGAVTNAACLNRLNLKFKNIVIAANLPDAERLLQEGKADVLFSPRTYIPGLETFPQRYHCEENGTAMLTRKGSALVAWWNKAFEIFVETGKYQQQCQESSIKYNRTINCFKTFELIPKWDPTFNDNDVIG